MKFKYFRNQRKNEKLLSFAPTQDAHMLLEHFLPSVMSCFIHGILRHNIICLFI